MILMLIPDYYLNHYLHIHLPMNVLHINHNL